MSRNRVHGLWVLTLTLLLLAPGYDASAAERRLHGTLTVEVFAPQCETAEHRGIARTLAEAQPATRAWLEFEHAGTMPRGCARLSVWRGPNLIVDAGEQFLVQAWLGNQTLSTMRFHSLGTNATGATEGQTGCLAELTTEYASDNVRATGTLLVGSAANIMQTVGSNSLDTQTTVREWCLMSSASVGAGVMWSRIVIPDTLVPLGGIVVTTYNLTME